MHQFPLPHSFGVAVAKTVDVDAAFHCVANRRIREFIDYCSVVEAFVGCYCLVVVSGPGVTV